MKLYDTTISIGGMLRCCIATINGLDADTDFPDGFELDCKYETTRKKPIILRDGTWQWNQDSEFDEEN